MKKLFLFSIIFFCSILSTEVSFSSYPCPEWETSEGVIIVWQDDESFCSELIRNIRPDNTCYIVVESNAKAVQVEYEIDRYIKCCGNIEFFVFPYDDCWVADYSPIFVRNDRKLLLVDFHYFRSADDTFPSYLSSVWDIPLVEMPIAIEGGNLMTDGFGTCFVTDEIIDQNEGVSSEEIKEILSKYLGCHSVCMLEKLNDGTGHIDMFAKLIDPKTILIGEYAFDDPEYEILENNVSIINEIKTYNAEEFKIIRIPMPGSPQDYWTYTNSLILNRQVYVPVYNTHEDQIALDIYRDSMPGYEIIGICCRDLIQAGGAIHCVTKVVPKF